MNNNLSFSKNVFGGKGDTKIAGSRPMSMNNHDGGRMTIDEVITRLSGITCGFKSTSCPDQLATALKQIKEKKNLICLHTLVIILL